MDARQRINQIRQQNNGLNRKKFISNKKSNKNTKSLTDLRQLLRKSNNNSNNNNSSNNSNNNKNNSVKNRIGFFAIKKKLNQKKTLISDQKNKMKIKQKQNGVRIPVVGDDRRIPKVMVNLSQVKSNEGLILKNKIGSRPKNRSSSQKSLLNRGTNLIKTASSLGFNAMVSSQPVIIPQVVPQTSVPTYIVASSPPIYRNSYSATNRINETDNANNTVIVTNLNKSITQQDINELFGEIGPLVKASKINPSAALIVYENGIDAKNACQTYHNRLLDGMAMQCNILSHSQNAYTINSLAQTQSSSYRTQSSRLLAAQLRQINSSSSQTGKMTAAQMFANNNRVGNPNVKFTVNI